MSREQPAPPVNLLLKGGWVIDPANGIDGPLDVLIGGKTVARVAADIPPTEATQTIDVSGLYVTPGILDIHTHVYTFPPQSDSYVEGMNADAHLFASGVTTTVDAGTAGWQDLPDFKTQCIDRAQVRILAFLNVARRGMLDRDSEQSLADLNPAITAAVAAAYPELIVGIKTAHYWTNQPWDD
ncbi:MAG: amidohydrolase/deacetylase family metallohydrolase, partial [Anaerolineae bacterium]|nr:amidohydrolase/deacetylase family metallohydrolase [Anaerolineae bacterium]